MGGFPPQGAGGSGTDTIDVDVIDRATRLLGIIYGSQGQQVLQRAATFELLVQLRDAGVEIDPRQIRDLDFSTDQVDVSGSSVTATISGTPEVDVTDRAARLLGVITGSVTTTTSNRSSFSARSLQNIGLAGVATQLPDISVPDGFAAVIRATPGNTGLVYVATSAANTNVSTSRNTLDEGDSIKLFITNTNLVYVAGSITNQNVDIIVEQ